MFSKKYLLLALVLIGEITASCTSRESDKKPLGRSLTFDSRVDFITQEGLIKASVRTATANTPELRSLGLMDVYDLRKDEGMLFIFDNEEPLSFWMANTPLPLDIIFINSNFKIVRIHHNVLPFSQANYHSDFPALYVVEVHAGYCVNNDITEGQSINFELL